MLICVFFMTSKIFAMTVNHIAIALMESPLNAENNVSCDQELKTKGLENCFFFNIFYTVSLISGA